MTTNPPTITIAMTPCASSQISAYGYDEASQTLQLEFPGRGQEATRYRYAAFPPEQFQAFLAAESKGKFFGAHIRGHYKYEKQAGADGVVFGLLQVQEPKFTTSGKDGRLVNRSTGKPIPDDEPVFVLRAQDVHALVALRGYALLLNDLEHQAAVLDRIAAFEDFAAAHPERMKAPDTAAA